MKRKLALLLALTLLLGLTACNRAAEKADRGFDSARSFNHYFPVVNAAETTDTIYFISFSEQYLKYTDKASGISGILCGKPECRHEDKDCNAYLDWTKALFVKEERLYWIASLDGLQYNLYSMALDATDRRTELELPQELTKTFSGLYLYTFDDDCLYLADVKKEVVDGEPTYTNYVGAFPFDAKAEPYVILQEESQYHYYGGTMMIQAYGGYLYILTTEEAGPVEAETAAPPYRLRLRRWDLVNGGMETLYEEQDHTPQSAYDLWVLDGAVLFSRDFDGEDFRHELCRYDLESGKCEHLFDVKERYGMSHVVDGLVSGQELTWSDGAPDEFHVTLHDFEGNLLLDDVYRLDFPNEFAEEDIPQLDLIGRDENYVYYSFYTSVVDEAPAATNYASIIRVALDGGGAEILCTQSEKQVLA